MPFQTRRMNAEELDKIFQVLLEGLEENAGLYKKRKIVNSILPMYKNKLLERFLSDEEDLSQEMCMKCLRIFLDENTKFLAFERLINDQEIVKSILKIIPIYSPNIETVDFRRLNIKNKNKNNFVIFLKQTTQLKSLQVRCGLDNCAIGELLLRDDFNLHDEDVKSGLLNIEYIKGSFLNTTQCIYLLKLLPNLKSLGMRQKLSVMLPYIRYDDKIPQKLSNITEFHDTHTNLITLKKFSEFCPKAKKLSLFYPEQNVIENLWKFPLLTELEIKTKNPDFFVTELNKMLKKIGKQITILILSIPNEIEIDPNTVHDLCPELVLLGINF